LNLPATPNQPIDAIANGQNRKASASYRARRAVDTTVLPIGGFASFIDPTVRRKSAVVEDITRGHSTGDNERC
jgi:hypothetical protein